MKLTKENMTDALLKVRDIGDKLYSLDEIHKAIGILEQEALPDYIDNTAKKVLWYGAEYFGLEYETFITKPHLNKYETLARNMSMVIAIDEYGCLASQIHGIVKRHRATFTSYFMMIRDVMDGAYQDKAISRNYHSCLQYIKLKINDEK
jgi:hypothetical protein